MASPRLFAEYVLKKAPTPDDVAAVLDALAPLLRQQMRHREVWSLPPSAWGYAGRSWSDEETFNDLLSHCFAFVFTGRRVDRLRDYARSQSSIDAVVRVSVRNFLNDKEREKNPAGHALFKNVQAAIAAGLADGWLSAVEGAQDTVTNQTVVAPARQPATSRAAPAALVAHLAPGPGVAALCAALVRRSRRGIRAATEVLRRLCEQAPAAWQVGELVASLKQMLPRETEVLSDAKLASVAAVGPAPSKASEDEDTLSVRSRRTSEAIAALPCQRKVKARLGQLWDWMLGYYRGNGRFPSQAEAAKGLNQERQRVNDDYARLRPLLVEIWELKADG